MGTPLSQKKAFKGGHPASKAKLGSGGRFKALKNKLSHQKGVYNPGGLAGAIERKKYGAAKAAKLSAAGRRKK